MLNRSLKCIGINLKCKMKKMELMPTPVKVLTTKTEKI